MEKKLHPQKQPMPIGEVIEDKTKITEKALQPEKQQIDVDKLIENLRNQQLLKTVQPLPFSATDAERLLRAAISAQVKNRGGVFQLSSPLANSIKAVAEWLTTMNKPSLFICGTLGNGKTTIVKAIQNIYQFLDLKDWRNQKLGFSIVTSKTICNHWKTDYKFFRLLIDEPMLAVDDLGNEPKEILDYGNVGNPLIELFEHRYEKQLTTIVTSNLTAKQIREDYYDRIADRFNEIMCVVPFTDQSYRGKNTKIIQQYKPSAPESSKVSQRKPK